MRRVAYGVAERRIGRHLAVTARQRPSLRGDEVELRAPDGAPLQIASIGFMDLAELASLGRRLDCNRTVDAPSVPPGGPEFVVSVTLRQAGPRWPRTAVIQ